MDKPRVLIVMGSDSDIPVMDEAAKVLGQFGVPFEMRISSAHRCPDRTAALAAEA
jgi:5-(carboxyamino)imidazole ribonucleotide mutase